MGEAANGTSTEREGWRPSASQEMLVLRARILAEIRAFFAEGGVMEVETPLLNATLAPETHLDPIACFPCGNATPHYLHTSPEAAMKRLLAAGSGPIYQICRAFRAQETGRLHNPEFTMLEWYRPGWDYQQLSQETALLAQRICGCGSPQVITYRQAFQQWAGLDPFTATIAELTESLIERDSPPPADSNREALLDLLLVSCVEPGLGRWGRAVILCDFPADQAAMAEIAPGTPPVAKRFELYLDGIELANGYQELTDPVEQEERLHRANSQRQQQGKSPLPLDHNFLQAIQAGLPRCAGVALGVDRLIMATAKRSHIHQVLAFPLGCVD